MQNDITVSKNEHLILPILWTGSEEQMTYRILLEGVEASVTLLVLLIGKKAEKVTLKATIEHISPRTTSKVIVKGVLWDNASIQFDGLVKIHKGAKGTNAWLAAHILLLSKSSKGVAVPALEILENDIKAGHATTVGRVNDIELFYLMSRGLSYESATGLIIQGFLDSLLKEFPKILKETAEKEVAGYAGRQYESI